MNILLFIILIVIGIIIFLWMGYIIGRKIENQDWLLNKLEPIVKNRIKISRSVLGGQFSEQLAPYLPDFPYSPTECRFVGKPIDLIVFPGMDNKEITEVKFVEIKSGKSGPSIPERKLRDVIKDKKVTWEIYRIPEEITKRKEK